MENLFASAVASADVRPAPVVALTEAAVVAAEVVVAFAAIAALVGISAVATSPTMTSFEEKPFARATFMVIASMFAAN